MDVEAPLPPERLLTSTQTPPHRLVSIKFLRFTVIVIFAMTSLPLAMKSTTGFASLLNGGLTTVDQDEKETFRHEGKEQQQQQKQLGDSIHPANDGVAIKLLVNDDENKGKGMTFAEAVSTRLDWKVYDELVRDGGDQSEFLRKLFYLAVQFAIMEPKTPINERCQPPPLKTPPPASSCSTDNSNAFTGAVRQEPRKVGHAIQFGFDVDTLEILLRELYDVVDKFFIVEWTLPHNQRLKPKPLLWEAVKTEPRFAFCMDKVVHIVMDDVDTTYTSNEMWSVESLQEMRRWQKIDEWNTRTLFFGPEDLIGFGDTDEIPSRMNVHLLKNCEWESPSPVDVGIWFPMGRINRAFQTDFPVGSYRYSIGDPTYFQFQAAQEQYTKTEKVPSRNRGTSPFHIFGGAHFTNYGYLIYLILKDMSCTECQLAQEFVLEIRSAVETGKWQELELKKSTLPDGWAKRTVPLDELDPQERQKVVYLPWFYDCNRDRYSMWEGRPDSRIA